MVTLCFLKPLFKKVLSLTGKSLRAPERDSSVISLRWRRAVARAQLSPLTPGSTAVLCVSKGKVKQGPFSLD